MCRVQTTSEPVKRHQTLTLRLRADRIRKRAADRGATSMIAMAGLFGCSRQHVHSLLTHKYLPSVELAQQMADVLEMPVEDLWERT